MDSYFATQYDNLQITEYVNVSSPEMFDSDAENDVNNRNDCALSNAETLAAISPQKPSQAELIAKSDNYLLTRVNKFLSGIPPPPKHTICQNDCSDFLQRIYENSQFFWIRSPFPNKNSETKENASSPKHTTMAKAADSKNISYQCTKGMPRNLTDAFNACDLPANNVDYTQLNISASGSGSNNLNVRPSVPKQTNQMTNVNEETIKAPSTDSDRRNVSDEQSPLLYYTLGETEVAALNWPEARSHKFHGIHYNRSRSIEEFENLSIKLCDRYIGNGTQSTCNVWFSKQLPGSARKRKSLTRIGQSPGKRLTYLAKRRKTFSSANLQEMGLADKRQLIVQIKKPMHKKGKSPRGKSPRGKSPRGKSPRSSTKKKVVRRLLLDGASPRKSKLETSKRALFQSPPTDAGPSKLLGSGNVDSRKIKRVLFPMPKKKESELEETVKPTSLREETRKRKCEEELEGPRLKWPKSLSFDCTHELQNATSRITWDRHSSSTIPSKNETSFDNQRNELSDTHRKKLLWAVAEALRSKGIGMSHPKFKQYAMNLARTIKKYMPDLENKNIPRKPGSTTDRMLKLAKHHVLLLIDGAKPMD